MCRSDSGTRLREVLEPGCLPAFVEDAGPAWPARTVHHRPDGAVGIRSLHRLANLELAGHVRRGKRPGEFSGDLMAPGGDEIHDRDLRPDAVSFVAVASPRPDAPPVTTMDEPLISIDGPDSFYIPCLRALGRYLHAGSRDLPCAVGCRVPVRISAHQFTQILTAAVDLADHLPQPLREPVSRHAGVHENVLVAPLKGAHRAAKSISR